MLKLIIKKIYIKLKFYKKNIKISNLANIGLHSYFEGNNKIGANTSFNGEIGYCSYIGDNCCIDGKIGKYCSIASEVKITHGTHPINFFSSSPVFYSNSGKQCGKTYTNKNLFVESVYADNKERHIIIGNDVWIGFRATILSGVRIGNGAIIGAGAVVTKDVPPYAIVGGVPAKIIRYRFSSDIIKKLLEIKWWDLSEEKLKLKFKENCNVELFLKDW